MENMLTAWGSVASLLGLGVSVYIAIRLPRMRNRAKGIVKMPEIRRKVQEICDYVAANLAFESASNHLDVIGQMLTQIQQIGKYKVFSTSTQKSASRAGRAIKKFKKSKSPNNWDQLYLDSIQLRDAVESDCKDLLMEGIR